MGSSPRAIAQSDCTPNAPVFVPRGNGTPQPTLTLSASDPCRNTSSREVRGVPPSPYPTNTPRPTVTGTPGAPVFVPPSCKVDSIGLWRSLPNQNGIPGQGNGVFYLKHIISNGFPDITIYFGVDTDLPVVGDWDGNGIDTPGVVRNVGTSLQWYLTNITYGSPTVAHTLLFGAPGDIPIAGDWDGPAPNGIVGERPGVYRRTKTANENSGYFYLRNSFTSGLPDTIISFNPEPDLTNLQPFFYSWSAYNPAILGLYNPTTGRFWLKVLTDADEAALESSDAVIPEYVDFVAGAYQAVGCIERDWITRTSRYAPGSFNNGIFSLQHVDTSQPNLVLAYGAPGDIPLRGIWAQQGCFITVQTARYGFRSPQVALLEQLSPGYNAQAQSNVLPPTPISVGPADYVFIPSGTPLRVWERYNEIAVKITYNNQDWWIDSGFTVGTLPGAICDTISVPQASYTPSPTPTPVGAGTVNDLITELATYGITAYAGGLPAGTTLTAQAWTVEELRQVLVATQKTAAAFNLLRNGDRSGSSQTAKNLFRAVMVPPAQALEIWRTTNGFSSGTCAPTFNQGCTDNGFARIGLDGNFNGTTAPEYTVVHEFGHRFNNQSAPAGSLFNRMGGGSISVTVLDCPAVRVFGLAGNDWVRGARGWGSGPNRSEFQQNITNEAGVGQLEVDEAVADMFLNWVYRKTTEPTTLYNPIATVAPSNTPATVPPTLAPTFTPNMVMTIACAAPAPPSTPQAYLWQGFQNRSWLSDDGVCSSSTAGCTDFDGKPGNIRFAWMERQIAEIFELRGW